MIPIKATAGTISTSRKAKVMPMARASMLVQRFPYHVDPNDPQQDKCDPVVDRRDGVPELYSQKITGKRHSSLKTAKPQTYGHRLSGSDLFHRQPLADGYGKSIHGKSYRQDK